MDSTNNTTGSAAGKPATEKVKDELGADAAKLRDKAKETATAKANEQKDQATKVAQSASSAIEKAASELESDDNAPSWLTSAFRQAAKHISTMADTVDNRDPQQMVGDVNRYARQNPSAFLGASAAIGFAAARFFKAGAEHRSDDQAPGQGSGGRNYRSANYNAPTGSTATAPPTRITVPPKAGTARTSASGGTAGLGRGTR